MTDVTGICNSALAKIGAARITALGEGSEKLDARVTQFDKKNRKLSVSVKALEIAEEKEAVAQYGSSDSGASLGDILGAALKAREGDDE